MSQLALIKDGTVVQTVVVDSGFNLPDGSRVSPAETAWPGVDGYTLAAIVDADPVPEGKRSTGQAAQMVDGAPKWVHTLADIPPEPFRPIPPRDCFQIVLREFDLTRATLRTMAGDFGAANPPNGMTADQGRESALIDFDEASEFHHDNPLLIGVMTAAGLSPAQRDAKWREWQAGLV